MYVVDCTYHIGIGTIYNIGIGQRKLMAVGINYDDVMMIVILLLLLPLPLLHYYYYYY